MRRTLIGMMAAGALIVAGGCSDGDDENSSNSEEEGDSGGGGSGGSSEDFCSTVAELTAAASTGSGDQAEARQTLTELEPPEEIAEEWDEYLAVVSGAGEVDQNDPEAVAEYQEQLAAAEESGVVVNDYLTEECGLDDSTGQTGDTTGDNSGGGEGSGETEDTGTDTSGAGG